MKKRINKKSIACFLLASTTTFSFISKADDIEIYLGSKDTDASVNIMFMLDTSGSMDERVYGTYDTRMQQAKEGLKEVIAGLPGDMKVGLGRFNDPGGSILYPARRLDALINEDTTETVNANTDDAYEKDSGETFIDTTELLFEPDIETVTLKVLNDNYDAEQCSDGREFIVTSQYPSIPYDESYCKEINGFIFKGSNIPQGADIVSANMVLYTESANVLATTKVFIENTTDADYYGGRYSKDIIGRNYYSNSELWFLSSSTNKGDSNTSPDLTDSIQKLVDRSDWKQSDNSIGIKLESIDWGFRNGYNTYYSAYVGNNNLYPELKISYRKTKNSNKVGLRFPSVNAPSNTTVSKGMLKLIASQDNGDGKLKIKLESGGETETFAANDNNISDRGTDNIELEIPYENWNLGEEKLFDVASILQNKFNTYDWCGGGSLSFIVESDNAKGVYAIEHSAEYSPQLLLKYDGGSDASCRSYDEVLLVNNESDDSYQHRRNRKGYPYSSSVYIDEYGYGGFIFRNTGIPPKAKIKSAYISLMATSNNDDDDNIKVDTYVIKHDRYPISVYDNRRYDISKRLDEALGNVNWNIGRGVSNNQSYSSPDLTNRIQDVVDSSAYYNADEDERGFEIILKGDDDSFYAYSYDSSPGKAAKLVVTYEGVGTRSTTRNSTMTASTKSTKSTNDDSNMTVRQYLINLIDEQPANGSTPMEGSLYEAGQYFAGREVNYGRSRNVSQSYSSTLNSKRISGEKTFTGGTVVYPNRCDPDNLSDSDCREEYISGSPLYTSPMTDNLCESNNLILITDGYPTSARNYSSAFRDYNNVPLATLIKNETGVSCNSNWTCATEWVSHMFNNDFQPEKAGKNNIFTHIIGFNQLDSEGELRKLSATGGGIFAPANNTTELVNALNMVIASIMEIESTLATPGVAVNQNDRTQHLSDVYYSVFQPSVSKFWYGNLKKYNINESKKTIVDVNDIDAVDPITGFFASGTTSYWSDEEDGGVVEKGGAASQLNTQMSAYTWIGNNPNNEVLKSDENRLTSTNDNLTRSVFGIGENELTNTQFSEFLNWLGGQDVLDEDIDGSTDDARRLMGDPLHSRPVLISYGDDKNAIFVSTNEGYLHAVDDKTGEEYFSFMPQELLNNAYLKYQGGSGNHLYGLDASWVAWRHDENQDGKITVGSGDQVIIYSGMRRGGNNFYAIDVTDLNNPKLLFEKKPEDGGIFEDMGQTWSEPVLGRVKINGTEKAVLIFAGGYDTAYDSDNYLGLNDSQGSQLFMLDASNGDLLWSASGSDSNATLKVSGMDYSITSRPTLVDLKGNGYIDMIYLTDLGGQIIKFKFSQENTGLSNFATGKVIAKLGKTDGAASVSNARMFFDSVAVAPIKDGYEKYVAIVAGTGYRSHPLNRDKKDIIVMIKDKEDFALETETITTPITLSNLANITNTLNAEEVELKMANKNGFYIELKESGGSYIGEKATGEPLIYDNQIIINTYVPDENSSECMPVIGYSRGYRMSVFNGTPTSDRNQDGNITEEDRYVDNLTSGIANGSKIIYTKDGVLLLTNTKVEKIGSGGDMGLSKRRWYILLDDK